MAIKRLSMVRGDTQTYNLVFKNSSGVAYCMKNWVVVMTAKTNPTLSDAQASFQKIVTTFPDTTSGTSGSATITINPSDTVNLEPQEYDFDIQVTTAANENFTVLRGKLNIEYDVTRAAGTAGTAA